jgi:hypothetical protein
MDFMSGDGIDYQGHGAHVACTIAANTSVWPSTSRVLFQSQFRPCPRMRWSWRTSGMIAAIDDVTVPSTPFLTMVNLSLGGEPNPALDAADTQELIVPQQPPWLA